MTPWITPPQDAIDHVSRAFAAANLAVTERLFNLPNIRETSLDDAFVDALIPHSAPHLLRSGTTVKMDIHNIGGLKRYRRWEVADIAVLVFIFRHSNLVCQKIGMLQSKRLYPLNNDVDDDDPVGFWYGLNAFLRRGNTSSLTALHMKYDFDSGCVYGALKARDEQMTRIRATNRRFGESTYFLFYNPHEVPLSIAFPITARNAVQKVSLGCRVYKVDEVHAVLKAVKAGVSPSLAMLEASTQSNWSVEHWAADLLLSCKVGRQFDNADDRLVESVLIRRTGPIGAAIALSIALPNEG
jgi:hypothetical protein